MEISKIIIPAAGNDNKFLPYTKTIPREMIPLLSKPAIQLVSEEAYKSEIFNLLFIIGKNKDSIVNYFNNNIDNFLKDLKDHEKNDNINDFEKIYKNLNINYSRQSESLGLGHAISMARNFINKEYFAIALPDDIICSKQPALSQLIRIARQEKTSVIAVQEVNQEAIPNYGIIAIKKHITANLFQVAHIVEKPHLKDAPSSLAVIGRYILSHKIFNSLDYLSNYYDNNISLSDAISHMLHQNEKVYAYKISGEHHDISTQFGFIKALIELSLQDNYLGPFVRKYMSEKINKNLNNKIINSASTEQEL